MSFNVFRAPEPRSGCARGPQGPEPGTQVLSEGLLCPTTMGENSRAWAVERPSGALAQPSIFPRSPNPQVLISNCPLISSFPDQVKRNAQAVFARRTGWGNPQTTSCPSLQTAPTWVGQYRSLPLPIMIYTPQKQSNSLGLCLTFCRFANPRSGLPKAKARMRRRPTPCCYASFALVSCSNTE